MGPLTGGPQCNFINLKLAMSPAAIFEFAMLIFKKSNDACRMSHLRNAPSYVSKAIITLCVLFTLRWFVIPMQIKRKQFYLYYTSTFHFDFVDLGPFLQIMKKIGHNLLTVYVKRKLKCYQRKFLHAFSDPTQDKKRTI